MSRIDRALGEFHSIDRLARRNQWVNRLHPLVKLSVTVLYIALVLSVPGRELPPLAALALYIALLFGLSSLSFRAALFRLRIVLPLVMAVGLPNPFFDRRVVLVLGGVGISGGVLSMLSLMGKGVLSILASYLLIATTPIEDLCCGLRQIHVPQLLVTELLLICRYISLLLSEARRVTEAYALRAPGEKGIAFRAWGSLAGQLLIRSIDRAETLYESMSLRGFSGEFPGRRRPLTRDSVLYLAAMPGLLLLLRFGHVAERIGGLITKIL